VSSAAKAKEAVKAKKDFVDLDECHKSSIGIAHASHLLNLNGYTD
jgi:hypothetical protein